MDYLKPSALITLTIMLASCAATRPPQPTHSPASLRVPSGDLISIKRFPYGGPKPDLLYIFKDDYDCYGIEPQPQGSIDELVIERKEFTTVMAQWGATGSASSCVVVHSFLTGGDSEFEVVAAAVDLKSGTCSLEVSSRRDGTWKPVDSYAREPVDPFWPEYGRHCKQGPLFYGSSLLPVPRGSE